MKKNNKIIPRLRFPDFSDKGEWKSDSLENIFTIRNGYTPAKDNPQFWNNGSIPWFRMEDIRLNGHILSDSIQHVTQEAVKGKGLFPAYSIIVATSATIGEHALITVESLANQRFTFLTKRKSYDTAIDMLYFHYYMFIVDEWCKKNTNIGGLLAVNMNAFKQLRIPFPTIQSEQNKIAECLSSIDSYISSINEKIEQLKAHKKSLLQKLFPQNGKTVPEYRFPEFEKDGAWVEIKVSDIFEITRGHVLAASNTKSAPDDEYRYPVFSSQTAKNGLMGYYNKPLYTDAITWTTDGANAGTVNYREGPFYCTNVCGVLLSNKGYANKCIAELLSMEAKKHVSYVGNPKLMNNVMAEIKLYIPSIREQHRIASCLSSIDMLRQVNTEKRVQLEKIKKGLVQHLFPQI